MPPHHPNCLFKVQTNRQTDNMPPLLRRRPQGMGALMLFMRFAQVGLDK
jgi:hypothetical protein